MKISHRWFRSGSYVLAAHLQVPAHQVPAHQVPANQVPDGERGSLGALIVPPFGWEDICSYRPLRFLGEALAASGIPTLRFDLPGTGDSSGDAQDAGLAEAWIRSIDDAAAELRAATGVTDVAVVGFRSGAMLALAASIQGANLQDLILWGATLTGSAMLRELRALHQIEQQAVSSTTPAEDEHVPGLEIIGFPLSPETLECFQTLNFSVLPRMERRILLLTRDGLPSDQRLLGALKASGAAVTVAPGHGYSAMLAEPHAAVPPLITAELIARFLQNRDCRPAAAMTGLASPAMTVTAMGERDAQVVETIQLLECSKLSVFGVMCEPRPDAPRDDFGVLFLNPGAVRHIGSNRMWVQAARRWAARGVPSLRLDFTGVGESDGEQTLNTGALYQGPFIEQVEAAMDVLRLQAGVRRFGIVGLCSGAFWAFQAATRNPSVRGAVLLNPRLFFWDPEVDRRRMLRRTVNGLTDSSAWRHLAHGQIKAARIRQAAGAVLHSLQKIQTDGGPEPQIPPAAMARALALIEGNGCRLTLIFTEGEPLLREMEEESQMPPEDSSWFRCIRIADGGHTFRDLAAQRLVHGLIDRELQAILEPAVPCGKRTVAVP
jgi:pimeloyl-ACP methyl ester carboxylesterase